MYPRLKFKTNRIKGFLLWSFGYKKSTKRAFNWDIKKITQEMFLFTIFLEFSKQVLSNKIRVMEPAFVIWIVRSNSTRFSLFAVPGSLNLFFYWQTRHGWIHPCKQTVLWCRNVYEIHTMHKRLKERNTQR